MFHYYGQQKNKQVEMGYFYEYSLLIKNYLEHEGQTIQHQDTIKHVCLSATEPSLCVRVHVHDRDIKYMS